MSTSRDTECSMLAFKPSRLPVRERRAAVACLACRGRKVRCDVTVNGPPCTNCRLSRASCAIAGPRRPRNQRTSGTNTLHKPVLSQTSTGLSIGPCVTNQTAALKWSAKGAAVVLPEGLCPPVLAADTSWLSPHARARLTRRKALSLPKRAIIHTLLQNYFIRIYPLLPLIKDTAFRESAQNGRPFSLLVFRAMLFASSCVSLPSAPLTN